MTQESPRCHVEIDASVRHVSKNFTRSDVNAHCVVGRRHVADAVLNKNLPLDCFYLGAVQSLFSV